MLKIQARGKKGIFQVVGKVRGRRICQSTGTTSRSHAEAQRIQLEKQLLDEQVYGKRPTATFSSAIEAYLDSGGSSQFLDALNEHFGRWLLSNISQDEVVKYAKLKHPKSGPHGINRQVFTPLIAVWEAGRKVGMCGRHEFTRPRMPERNPVDFAKDDYIAQLLPACSDRLKAAVLFMTFSGARASECCRLSDEAGDIDWQVKTAILRRTKNGKPRIVVLPDTVYKALLRLRGTKGPVFGLKTRFSLNQALARACRRAGLPLMTSHQIGRHAFAARLLRERKTLKEVQEAGGWSAASLPMLAEVYGHLEKSSVDEMIRQSDAALDQLLKKKTRKKLKRVA